MSMSIYICMTSYNFEGENLCEFGTVHKIWGCGIFGQHQQAFSQKFSLRKVFPLYCSMRNADINGKV